MQFGEPSRTAQAVALQRAAHQILERPRIFEDPLALRVIGAATAQGLRNDLAAFTDPLSRGLRAAVVARSRYAEDQLSEAVGAGVRQYVVLGAGLDTFAHRNPYPQLAVYEVDHPATQAWKHRLLQEIGLALPGSARLVAVDFHTQRLVAALTAAGFQWHARCFVSWLGVTVYLEHAAIRDTLSQIASAAAPGSRIVFDYALRPELMSSEQRVASATLARRAAAVGEPWQTWFAPQELHEELQQLGYARVQDVGATELNQRYFGGREDGFAWRGAGRLASAEVAPRTP